VIIIALSGAASVFAHIPVVLERQQATTENPFQIRDAITSMAYYDVIYDTPRVYNIVVKNSGELYIGLTVPKVSDTPQCKPTVSLINDKNFVIYETIGKNIVWINFHEPFGNADYFRGSEANVHVIPGQYTINVSSETENCKYALATGEVEKFQFNDFISSVYIIPIINQNFFEMNPIQSIMNMSGIFMVILGLVGSMIIFIVRKIIKSRTHHKKLQN
jgi:hypothetical protein